MYTADMARRHDGSDELDLRIKRAVREAVGNRATIRVYIEDPFCHSIKYELERRGFINVDAPQVTLKGDVWFEWEP